MGGGSDFDSVRQRTCSFLLLPQWQGGCCTWWFHTSIAIGSFPRSRSGCDESMIVLALQSNGGWVALVWLSGEEAPRVSCEKEKMRAELG
ncbi:hypothetical protein RIF29_39350 [Crotalaria pallida]|uniref:Uncharacterized protein n=1 Tax=Crotalaria pallida TaxID=3830 RepID=A0AAN9E3H2_CROPI